MRCNYAQYPGGTRVRVRYALTPAQIRVLYASALPLSPAGSLLAGPHRPVKTAQMLDAPIGPANTQVFHTPQRPDRRRSVAREGKPDDRRDCRQRKDRAASF